MANYIASARSNYFRVKDRAAFIEELPTSEATVYFQEIEGTEHCCILFENGISYWACDEDDEELNIDWAGFFSKHLAEDSVVIFMEAGTEKLRYINGYALAYNAKGEQLSISIDGIYELVTKEWGRKYQVTDATY